MWLHSLGITTEGRSEEHTSELQSLRHLVCRLLLEKKRRRCRRRGWTAFLGVWLGCGPRTPPDRQLSGSRPGSRDRCRGWSWCRSVVEFFLKPEAPPETFSLPLRDPFQL